MASLRELRRRIKSAENIRGITKAMEIISAVRYKKFTMRYRKSTMFFAHIERLLIDITSESTIIDNPFFAQRERKRELLIVITGERGLCGSFNSSILRELMKYLAAAKDRQIALYPIGKISVAFARRRDLDVWRTWSDLGNQFTADSLKSRTNEIIAAFLSGEFDEINVLTVSLSRAGTSKPIIEPFLDLSYILNKNNGKNENKFEYIFEPNPKAALKALANLFIKQKLFVLLLKSITAEYFARMVAMKQATENGKEVIKRLSLERNKVRQAMITRELSEIIGGADALK